MSMTLVAASVAVPLAVPIASFTPTVTFAVASTAATFTVLRIAVRAVAIRRVAVLRSIAAGRARIHDTDSRKR
jgi:hypothetical protein